MDIIWKNLDTIMLVVLIALRALEYLAPKTETKIDDKIVCAVNWALQHTNGVFAIIEDLKAVGILKGAKTEAFREELQKQYRKVYGQELPSQALAAAENVAAGLAAEDHNLKRLAAAVNPPAAPSKSQ
ncbi:MAG: hypothetical protein PHN44_11855 [Candidatus Marinimicrobia bacterium]|nr:hypothetical protein [Candidatus Neomarinimicrobiota bacterium]